MSEDKEWFSGRAVDDEEARVERSELRKIVGILLVVGIAVGVLVGATGCASSPAPAAEVAIEIPLHVFERGRTSIRLMRGPCVDAYSRAFIARMAPEYLERLRAIDSTWPMNDGSLKAFAGCWIEFSAEEMEGEPAIGMIFEDGQRLVLPKSELRPGGGA